MNELSMFGERKTYTISLSSVEVIINVLGPKVKCEKIRFSNRFGEYQRG